MDQTVNLPDKLALCITACNKCLFECLNEDHIKMMTDCIRLTKDCSVICSASLELIHEDGKFNADMLTVCEKVCNACGDECRRHEQEHCQECAKACDECAQACRKIIYE